MEPVRNHEPQDGFLQKIRDLATKNNIVLIFDEITAGFRRTVGGIHKFYKVNPDIAVLGKAMGNGYAISAVIGKKEIMEHAQSTFISSTFWTERIGPVAALETIRIMERDTVPANLEEQGTYLQKCWGNLAKKCGLEIVIEGIPALSHFVIKGYDRLVIKTFITQEMLKHGYLAADSLYVCNLHSRTVIDDYISVLEEVFRMIIKGIENNNLELLLEGNVCQSGFKRLT
jgi:glutamate-1-semialdehyde 2,1-aminomutase